MGPLSTPQVFIILLPTDDRGAILIALTAIFTDEVRAAMGPLTPWDP